MAATIQFKRATAARWYEVNPILGPGEPGFIKDENRFIIGDGVTPYRGLRAIGDGSVVNAPTKDDFPSVGRPDMIYKAEEEKICYQWNTTTHEYEPLVSNSGDILDIKLINGGNANG